MRATHRVVEYHCIISFSQHPNVTTIIIIFTATSNDSSASSGFWSPRVACLVRARSEEGPKTRFN